jgi:hypothetical protein
MSGKFHFLLIYFNFSLQTRESLPGCLDFQPKHADQAQHFGACVEIVVEQS